MTLREVCQALIDGKKIRNIYWPNNNSYIYLRGGETLVNERGEADEWDFSTPGNWSLYEEQPHRSEQPEDLDKKIENKRLDLHACLGATMASCSLSYTILDIIDLKIKQAKLG